MISCDDCQRKLVAILDNEGSRDDEELTNAHLRDCSACRAFRDDMVRIRQQFAAIAVPSLPAAVEQELMQVAQSDSPRRENRRRNKEPERQPLLLRFPRLVWASGLAALFLIAASWLVSFSLAQKVEALKQELETSRRDIALAREKQQLEEAQERQQKAISALYFRMQELEQRIERSGPPRPASFPVERNGL